MPTKLTSQRPGSPEAKRRRGAALLITVIVVLLVATAATKLMIENQVTDRRSRLNSDYASQLQRAVLAVQNIADDDLIKRRLPVGPADRRQWVEFEIHPQSNSEEGDVLVARLTDGQRELSRLRVTRNHPIAGDLQNE